MTCSTNRLDNYYSLLGVQQNAGLADIKKAFRERAKRIHPDIAGKAAEAEMRRLLTAYEVLSNRERRFEYDRAYARFMGNQGFDYRTFLKERSDDGKSQAKLIFFLLLHLENTEALEVWTINGGLEFPLERYLDREDWMDCVYLLAEELEGQGRVYETVTLLTKLVREERRKPYFKHFSGEVETFLKETVRLKLKPAVSPAAYTECLAALLGMGFPPKDESRWLRSMAEAFLARGEHRDAEIALREALKLDPGLPNVKRLRQKLGSAER